MPIKRDGTGKRWVEMELLVPGTPEQVWAAMATGPGNTAWFTKATIEERVGGALHFNFGPGATSSGEVTAWEPPRRFGYVEREWSPDAPPVATEITITSRAGSQCVVRMVHSLFSSSDEWDDQMEGFESGWPGFFEVLKLYLAHHAGMKGSSFMAMTSVEAPLPGVWTRLIAALGLSGANVGERREGPAQPERLAGEVARIQQDAKVRALTLHLDAPAPGVAIVGVYGAGARTNAGLSLYLYGESAAELAAASEGRWRAWLEKTLAAQ